MIRNGARGVFAFLIMTLAGVYTGFASQKPNFSGVWKYNPSKSNLQIPPPTSSTLEIEHNEPDFILTRTHYYEEVSDTWGIHLTTDGKEVIQEEGEEKLVVHLYWEGNQLVFDSKIYIRNREASNIVKYALSEDGNTLIATEHFCGPVIKYDNVWVFDKE
jgi:hypothetical protein